MDFDKIQFIITFNEEKCKEELSFLNVEIAYSNTTEDFIWKSKARIVDNGAFLKSNNSFVLEQITWKNISEELKSYALDFYTTPSNKAKYKITYSKKNEFLTHTFENQIDCNKNQIILEYFNINILKTN